MAMRAKRAFGEVLLACCCQEGPGLSAAAISRAKGEIPDGSGRVFPRRESVPTSDP
jgi:hypothetical protein